MNQRRRWIEVVGGCLLLLGSGCTVQQQRDVLGGVGKLIPGSSNSVVYKSDASSSSSTSSSSSSGSQAATAETAPVPRVDPDRVEAQLVLHTIQRAMTDSPTSFQECLENAQCKPALTAHLIRLQKQAMSTLELPPAYDRYDLKRGTE